MKVFFNHLAKCGGTSIRKIAQLQYGRDFHEIKYDTTGFQLEQWLKKERVFIASELYDANQECCEILLRHTGVCRILLTRDPVERFKSFCSFATLHRQDVEQGSAFWSHDLELGRGLSVEAWFSAAVMRLERNTLNPSIDLCESYYDGFALAIASQWWLATFKHFYCFRQNSFHSAELYPHLHGWRRAAFESRQNMKVVISSFLSQYYTVVGTTEKFSRFVGRLVELGVFSSALQQLPEENKSAQVRSHRPADFVIHDERLIAHYFALIPEEFFLHTACMDPIDPHSFA